MRPRPLGERLVAAGVITTKDLDRALAYQAKHGGPLGAILVDLGICDMTPILAAVVAQRADRSVPQNPR